MYLRILFATTALLVAVVSATAPAFQFTAEHATFLGFDRNDYPGDKALPQLHHTFSFAGYWLNSPPGENFDDWFGRRSALRDAGFGFLVLFNGRLDNQLKRAKDAAALGAADAQLAVSTARGEGFAPRTIIFLDQEEGGRMLPEQNAYLLAWIEGVIAAGFHAGVYCSGMPASEGHGVSIVTANDIREHAASRDIAFFVYNDACPPSPGCVYPPSAPKPSASGVPFASIWQFAQSPRRHEFTAQCAATYRKDGNCYASGIGVVGGDFLDLDSATSPDPSNGR